MNKAVLKEASFSGEILVGEDIKNSVYTKCFFTDCVFRRCNFSDIIFLNSQFYSCEFEECSFVNVGFVHSSIVNSYFSQMRQVANLRLIRCNGFGTTFEGQDRKGIYNSTPWYDSSIDQSEFRDCDFGTFTLDNSKITSTLFESCMLNEFVAENSKLGSVTFTYGYMDKCRFSHSIIDEVRIVDVDCDKSYIEGTCSIPNLSVEGTTKTGHDFLHLPAVTIVGAKAHIYTGPAKQGISKTTIIGNTTFVETRNVGITRKVDMKEVEKQIKSRAATKYTTIGL